MPNPPTSGHEFDPLLQTEDIAFKPEELVVCGSCSRTNPPNRLKCFYCAADLAIPDPAAAKLAFRKLDPWERGWNVIILGASDAAGRQKAAHAFSIDAPILNEMIERQVPVLRVESETEADAIRATAAKLGLGASVASDLELLGTRSPVRVAEIRFGEQIGFVDFNTRDLYSVDSNEVALIVIGSIEKSKTDTLEKRRRGKTELLNESATVADEKLVDIYTIEDGTGYRVHMTGFDFSCLGEDKGMLASENIHRLIDVLHSQSPNARVVTNYDKVRHLLDETWPQTAQKDHKGLVFAGLGKREFGKSESRNNLEQFTKFSRLQWHLL